VTIRREEPVSLGRIAEVERIAPPTVTKLVDRLCELGLVRREQDPADRRSINVVVSDRAIQLMDGTKQRKSAWLDFRLNQLSGEELSKLLDALPVLETLVPDEDR
jgi:DNA-binding MarR family transcriptional regulator